MNAPDVSVIIPAAGLGLRMGPGTRKPYIQIGNKPIIIHTLEAFYNIKRVKEIILVVSGEGIPLYGKEWTNLDNYKVAKTVQGGKRRQDSVYNGLCQVHPDVEIVLIHDAVRPFVSGKIINSVIEKVDECGAAIVAVPMKATVKKADAGKIVETVPRHNLWMAQTPQGFKKAILKDAYSKIRNRDVEFTDDAELVEKAGYTVEIVTGSDVNIKITTREDLKLAESILGIP